MDELKKEAKVVFIAPASIEALGDVIAEKMVDKFLNRLSEFFTEESPSGPLSEIVHFAHDVAVARREKREKGETWTKRAIKIDEARNAIPEPFPVHQSYQHYKAVNKGVNCPLCGIPMWLSEIPEGGDFENIPLECGCQRAKYLFNFEKMELKEIEVLGVPNFPLYGR